MTCLGDKGNPRFVPQHCENVWDNGKDFKNKSAVCISDTITQKGIEMSNI